MAYDACRFAPSSCRVSLSEEMAAKLLRKEESAADWSDDLYRRVEDDGLIVVLEIGKLRMALEPSRALAARVVEEFADAARRAGAPDGIRCEVDPPQASLVHGGSQTRTLLPHHDSTHSSYLSPSILDDPSFRAEQRAFSQHGITSGATHKMWQGFFLVNPGEGLSVTTSFNKVELLAHAYRHQRGVEGSLEDVARWLGDNIRRLWERRHASGLRYMTHGASFGVRATAAREVTLHWAEADFTSEQIERFPELAAFRGGEGPFSPVERLWNAILVEAVGLDWPELRRRYERCYASERFDLLLGNNLTRLHGGWMGGAGRVVQPMCVVLGEPSGAAYERWLADAWARSWRQAGLVEAGGASEQSPTRATPKERSHAA